MTSHLGKMALIPKIPKLHSGTPALGLEVDYKLH